MFYNEIFFAAYSHVQYGVHVLYMYIQSNTVAWYGYAISGVREIYYSGITLIVIMIHTLQNK